MPKIRVDDQEIHVPDYLSGQEVRNLPALQGKLMPNDHVLLVQGNEMVPVQRAQQYRMQEGMEVDTVAPSRAGANRDAH